MTRLQRAAVLAFCLHLLAGFSMAVVLRRGLETNSDLQDRLAFLVNYRPSWTFAWLTWTAAAIAILYFYVVFADVHRTSSNLAILLTVAGLGPDLAAQAIEIGVLPGLASHALSTNAAPELFLTLHRVAVMLSGYLGNGLYSVTAMLLAWSARYAYPAWVSSMGIAVGVFGIALSVAALLDSAAGMFWTNVFLVPSILIWLGGVAICRGGL
ncbi:MAG: hypothetical protein DMG14_00395 [Acidobacteria bacterium]|nr:MAG: hypothetical protein DMG14_00395 [Acidobacteriota bacterium]